MSDEINVNSENTPPRKNLATLGQVKDALDKRDKKIDSLKEEKVDNPYIGVVGQILEIETVDENGRPKTYKAVDKPTSGGEVSEENEEILNNAITDIIGTTVANAYTGKLTHKCVNDTENVHNGGMLCNDPSENGVLLGETKFNSSGDGRTEDCGTVNVRWIDIANSFGKNDFTFTPSEDVEIFAPSGEITRVDGTKANATTGGFGDLILHDTANNKYIVIAEAFVGNENVVFARTTTAESANVAPSMEFTEAQELVLTVDGVNYNIQNGLKKINSDYNSVSQYNGDIDYANNIFYWVLTNNYKGWIVLTSSDGLVWEFNKYIVPDKDAENLFIEGAIGYNKNNETFLIAGRTKTETGYMVLTAYHVPSGKQCTKLIPDCRIGSKPSIARSGYGYFVGHNIGNRSDYELLFVNTYYSVFSNPAFQTMDIWRVNSWHGVSTQYATIRLGKQSSHYGYVGLSGNVGYANLLHCYGMDGNQFMKKGASFTYDAFEQDALTLNKGNQASLENKYFNKGMVSAGYTLQVATHETLGGVKPVSKTDAMTQEVGVNSEGLLFTTPSATSGGSGGDSWETVGTITVTEGSTSEVINLTKAYKKLAFYLMGVKLSEVGYLNAYADSLNGSKATRLMYINVIANGLYGGAIVEKITAKLAVYMQSDKTITFQNPNTGKFPTSAVYFVPETSGATFSSGTIYVYGIPE